MAGYDVFQAGQDLSLSVPLLDEYTNRMINAVSATYTVFDEAEIVVTGPTAATVTVSGSDYLAEFTIGAAFNTVTASTMRHVKVSATDAAGNVFTVHYFFMLEMGENLEPGANSYGYFAALLRHASLMQALDAFNAASHIDKQRALISAYYNFGKCPITINEAHPNDLDEAELALLDPNVMIKLMRAQIKEANFLLGDEPILDRRRRGLISMSHGEVTEFFRTGKPLELPVCSDALKELSGYLNWNKRILRT